MKDVLSKTIYVAIVIAAFSGFLNSPVALLLGFVFALVFRKSFPAYMHTVIDYFLKIAVVGLGFGMLIEETLQTSRDGFALTFYSITIAVGLGLLLTRLLKLDLKLGHLLTSGTAICGGSAIAAIAPLIKANNKIISIALAIVFLLNAIALLIFPTIGQLLDLSQNQFGLWAAVAIHDTSSVVGAAMVYGDEALRVATTVKLSRTLWIIPLCVFSMFLFKTKNEKIRVPYFILLFVGAIFINSYHLVPAPATQAIVWFSKNLLVVTLFLIGSSVSMSDLKEMGTKPVILALSLWVFIAVFSLIYITH